MSSLSFLDRTDRTFAFSSRFPFEADDVSIMSWPGPDDGDSAGLALQHEAYARELAQQIALRRAIREEEEQARAELELKLQPGARSPSKWLVDGGRVDWGGDRAPDIWTNTEPNYHRDELQQQHGADTGEPRPGTATSQYSAAHSPFMRYRVVDEALAGERQRERASQLELRRQLDEQVQEKARLRAAEEQERRRSEAQAAREELRFAREQQIRAQRRLGYPSPQTPSVTRQGYEPIPSPQTARLEPPPAIPAARRQFHIDSDPQPDYSTQYGSMGDSADVRPPAAPVRANRTSSFGLHAETSPTDEQPSRQDVIAQYRALLNEIRFEREELRREREHVRNEREELREQRALLELENERMASLVDANRRLVEQQMELREREVHAQNMAKRDVVDKLPTPRAAGNQARGFTRPNHIREGLANLRIDVPPHRASQRRASPMSMDEFSAFGYLPTPSPHRTRNNMRSPELLRPYKTAARSREVDIEEADESPLDESLTGESVFVPLIADTLSPPARRPRSTVGEPARSPLVDSRVIKSRGFYDLEQDFEPPQPRGSLQNMAGISSALANQPDDDAQERKTEGSGDQSDEDEEEEEEEDEDDDEEEADALGESSSVQAPRSYVERFNGLMSWASASRPLSETFYFDDESGNERSNVSSGRPQSCNEQSDRSDEDDGADRRSSAASGLFKVKVLV